MSKKILIDSSKDEEIRVAVTKNGKLDDYEIELERKNAVKGDVYLAKITRIEPSLQAAFVDFGVNRHGFLPLTEIHPDYFKIPAEDQKIFKDLSNKLIVDEEIDTIESKENIEENKTVLKKNKKFEFLNFLRKYKIQDVVKPRQVILVQINKEERGLKGAALTTYLSFAGRYCVLMPNSLNKNGISRKISEIEHRNNLKKIVSSLNIPQKMSVIIRTAGIEKSKKEIAKDLDFLITQWNKIRETTLKSDAPKLIFEEGNVIKRTIRDLFTTEVDEVQIDGKKGYQLAKKFTKDLVPQNIKKIKLFKEKDKTLFNENKIENQINDLFSLKVNLESGGSIVINTTEALVAIDVNSGRNTSERNIESTALKTNLEAAVEIARQLRLRDLGGLAVIDFIDMDDYRNNFKVEKVLKNAFNQDRARVQVGRISMFGLLELSRQRLRSSLIERAYEKCNYCEGSGIILNSHSIIEQIIKVIKEKIIISKGNRIEVKCNSDLAEKIINQKKDEINDLENQYKSKIIFSFDNSFSFHEPSVEIINENRTTNLKDKDYKNDIKTKKRSTKKINKKTKIIKTKIVKKKKIIRKKSLKTNDKEEIKNEILNDKDSNEIQEKSGWWSK
tara:strand:- start:312 stop:2156 length:1845 start_codon:yes stop_codon:yes gene_type:complete